MESSHPHLGDLRPLQGKAPCAYRVPHLRHVRQAARPRRLIGVSDRIAVEALGAESGAQQVVAALEWVLRSLPVDILLVGPRVQSEPLCASSLQGFLDDGRLTLIDADPTVAPTDDPLASLVDQRNVAPWVAAALVKSGQADAAVFVGHTGAAVAASALVWGRIDKVTRPALAVRLPGVHGPVVLADTGAFPDATAEQLAEVAALAGAYARALGLQRPRVGLLSIGAEAGKGDALRKASAGPIEAVCHRHGYVFVGPVEGHDLALGERADVIVTDGFTGNIALKSMEGALAWMSQDPELPEVARRRMHQRMDAGAGAGAVLLGVKGLSVVTHGASPAAQIASAIALAHQSCSNDVTAQISAAFAD